MPVYAAVLGLLACIAGAGLCFVLARRKRKKCFAFLGVFCCVPAALFTVYLTLTAALLLR